jgi:hypothetical protein
MTMDSAVTRGLGVWSGLCYQLGWPDANQAAAVRRDANQAAAVRPAEAAARRKRRRARWRSSGVVPPQMPYT